MSSVDPFVIPIPEKLLRDQETREYFTYLGRFLHDLWVRTGGGNDKIDDLQDGALGSDSRRMAEIRQLTKKVRQLELEIQSLKKCTPKPKKEITEHQSYDHVLKKIHSRLNELELTVN